MKELYSRLGDLTIAIASLTIRGETGELLAQRKQEIITNIERIISIVNGWTND